MSLTAHRRAAAWVVRSARVPLAVAARLVRKPLAAALHSAWTGAAVAVLSAVAITACSAAQPAEHRPAGSGPRAPGAQALLASPARLIDAPVSSTGCQARPGVQPGTTARLLVAVPPASAAGHRTRGYWLHVPASYRPGRPVLLMLAFHGAGGTGSGMQARTGLSALADQRGFLVAYPQGLAEPGSAGRVGWAASGPRDPEAGGIDDGLFVSDLLTAIQAGYCVEPDRIVATGFSNGAGLVGYLACVLAGRISAFAAVEAEFFQIPGGCRPAHPASILDVHVLTDPVAPYAGVPARGSPDYFAPPIPAWLQGWALRDGCRGGPVTFVRSPAGAGERWSGCDDATAVTGYRLAAGGHSWPPALGGIPGSREVADFLAAHPLRSAAARWSPHPSASAPPLAARGLRVTAVQQFRLPTPGAGPVDIARGPGGTIWFTEFNADKIGRIGPGGAVTEFRVPTAAAGPYQISAAPDGAMWFTEYNTTKIGRVSPDGRVTEVALPRGSAGGIGITAGPGGRAGIVWVADPAGELDRVSASGLAGRTPVLAGSGIPFAVARGASGTAWISSFTGYFEHGRVLEQLGGAAGPRFVTLADPASDVDALTAGPAGSVWFTDWGAGKIGELTSGGRLRLFADPSPYSGLNDIAAGPDGAMWFTEQAGLIGRLTPAGTFSSLALPGRGSAPDGITAGPGRTIWVAETGADAIARIELPPGG